LDKTRQSSDSSLVLIRDEFEYDPLY